MAALMPRLIRASRHVPGVLDRDREHQPALAVRTEYTNFGRGGLDQLLGVGDLGELVDHVVVAAGLDAVGLDLGDGHARRERRQVAEVEQLLHRDLGGDVAEERRWRGGQVHAVAAELGAGPADRARTGVVLGQVGEERAPHALALGVDQVAFIGEHDVDATQLVGLLVDAADGRVCDLAAELLAPQRGREDADVGFGPDAADLVDVLREQFLLMHKDQDSGAWKLRICALCKGRNHQ